MGRAVDHVAADEQRVGRRRLVGRDGHRLERREHTGVHERRVDEDKRGRDERGRGLQVETARHLDAADLIAEWRQVARELADAVRVRPHANPDEHRLSGHEHVAAVERAGILDCDEASVGAKRRRRRCRLAPARRRARPGDDGHFVEHDGRVLDEDRIGQFSLRGDANHGAAGFPERVFVRRVLPDRKSDVNRAASQVRQLAPVERLGDSAREGDAHRRSHLSSATLFGRSPRS